jgi:SAM-dependent methyltransferase
MVLEIPKETDYYDGFNEYLFHQVPPAARLIVEVGCARGRLGHELKQQWSERTVIGVERDVAAAEIASKRLDQVLVQDAAEGLAGIDAGSVDCVIFGDVLEHLYDPEAVLRRARELLAPDGVVLVCVPNICHWSVVKALLRADPMYQPSGLLDATHIRFFSHATFIKMLLDVGLLPDISDTINSGGTEHVIPAATPLLEYFRVPPPRALKSLDAYQYIFVARRLPDVAPTAPVTPMTFVACINDEDQLSSNLLRSPCLWPDSPHEFLPYRDMHSFAEGFHAGLTAAANDVVVFVQQDMYLPAGWDGRFAAQVAQAEREFGQLGVVGLYGNRYRDCEPVHHGRIVDRDRLLDDGDRFPAVVDGLDEILLATRRDNGLSADPQLGFHFYGADLALVAAEAGLVNVVVDAPAYHNSLFADVNRAYHVSREALLRKWPNIRPLYTSMGRADTMSTPPEPKPARDLEAELSALQQRLDESEQHLAAVLGSRTWRAGRALARALRRP